MNPRDPFFIMGGKKESDFEGLDRIFGKNRNLTFKGIRFLSLKFEYDFW